MLAGLEVCPLHAPGCGYPYTLFTVELPLRYAGGGKCPVFNMLRILSH
jgi:hypothetical protein